MHGVGLSLMAYPGGITAYSLASHTMNENRKCRHRCMYLCISRYLITFLHNIQQ